MGKIITLSALILALMFLLLPVDMMNGLLLRNDINFPLSVAQLYKFIIIVLLFLSLSLRPEKLIFSLGLFLLLLVPSFFQVIFQLDLSFLLKDIIKVMRYLTPVFAFLFFVSYIKKGKNLRLLFNLVKFSYIILGANILLKYIGLGYPMYSHNNIGSKGFFFAGNETSVLLVILSSILAYKFWIQNRIKTYFLLFIITLFIGFTISSKTGMLGVLLTFMLIPLKSSNFSFSLKKLKRIVIVLFIVLPLFFLSAYKILLDMPIFLRFKFFWEKLDILTFVFSNRNNFFSKALATYRNEYNVLEKIIGVGQTKYELLNKNSIVEIDVADIFFSYGFIGLMLFIALISYIIFKASLLKRNKRYPYAGLVYLMILILLGISTIAGHVFSSGMAAIYLGLLFSLMYIKLDRGQ